MDEFSDYIVYVDESGDHGLVDIDPTYPVFVLAFCIFHKADYINTVVPEMQRIKFKWFGHDLVLIHEVDIRKSRGDFTFLLNPALRDGFLTDLNALVEASPFTLISTAIRKDELCAKYPRPHNPYSLGIKFCLERVYKWLEARGQSDKTTWIVVEKRGKVEDNALELEFRRICDGESFIGEKLPFKLKLADKKVNSCGLQLADMVARPIGRHVINPQQPNRAFDILEPKFDRNARGNINGFGLKKFP